MATITSRFAIVKDLDTDTAQSSTQTTLPIVTSVPSKIQPAGSILFNITAGTLLVSNGTTYLVFENNLVLQNEEEPELNHAVSLLSTRLGKLRRASSASRTLEQLNRDGRLFAHEAPASLN